MAIVQNPVIGRSRQSFANVTTTTWKGRNVLKSKTFSYNDRNTPAQQNNRAKIKVLSWAARAYRPFIENGLRRKATTVTVYNVFMSSAYNYPAASAVTASNLKEPDPLDMIFAKGNLPKIQNLQVTRNVDGETLDVTWNPSVTGVPTDAQISLMFQRTQRVVENAEEYAEDVDLLWNIVACSAGSGSLNVGDNNLYQYVAGYIISNSADDVSDSIVQEF